MDSAEAVDRSKREVRSALLEARLSRPAEALELARAQVCRHVLARASDAAWRRVAAYRPLRTEPGSIELLDGLLAAGVEVLVPVTLPSRDLNWRRWSDSQDEPPALLGLDAIADVDLALVPALAVSRAGVRLGRGGGSYDRALRRVGPSASVAAVLFDDELVDELPAAPWDVPVDSVVRPCGWTVL